MSSISSQVNNTKSEYNQSQIIIPEVLDHEIINKESELKIENALLNEKITILTGEIEKLRSAVSHLA